jgi:hypothetical protein
MNRVHFKCKSSKGSIQNYAKLLKDEWNKFRNEELAGVYYVLDVPVGVTTEVALPWICN